MYNFNTLFGHADASARRIAPNRLAQEFGEVSVREVDDRLQVIATVAMGAFLLGDGERCMTGLALDASQSMKDGYGRGRTILPEVSEKFIAQGRFEEMVRDGVVRRILTKDARAEAIEKGWAVSTRNIVQEPCVQMVENLIRTFATGGVSGGSCEVVYWACGSDGSEIESLGEVRHEQLGGIQIQGPQSKPFGPRTHLAPPLRYFVERTAGTNGVLVFVTDGHIDDEREVVAETHRLAADIKAKRRPSLKCVLLGIGRQVDREQLARVDDMEMPAGLEDVDIWNAKVLDEMRDMNDAWSEIFDPETVVATSIRIFDDCENLVFERTDEVKALIQFEMPSSSNRFEVILDGEMKIRQEIT